MPQVTYVGTADTPSTAVFWGVEMTKTQTYTVAANHPSLRHPWFTNADAQATNTTANTAQSTPTTQATNVLLDELDNLFNGVTTTFALKLAGTAFKPETAAQLNVHIDNTYMVPGTDFTVSNTSIVFAKAPPAGANGTIIALNTSSGSPVTSVAGRTGAITLAKADVGLGNVDNTADTAKPVSTAQQTALNGKMKAFVAAPSTASSTGTVGDIAYDSGYVYVCTATDTWKRAAIATW